MSQCVKCGIPQESRKYGKIFLTNDGYCSVCNVKYKDRPRIKSIFKFTTKNVENKHLDSQGRKLTKDRKLLNHLYNTAKSGESIKAGVLYRDIKKKRNIKLERWL